MLNIRGAKCLMLCLAISSVCVFSVFSADTSSDDELLIFASGHGDVSIVKNLVSSGANPNAQDREGETPLCAASRGGHRTIVESLIRSGANVNLPYGEGETPLHAVVSGAHIDVAVKEGTRNIWGSFLKTKTPELQFDTSIVKLLLDNGANVNARDEDGETPLQAAARSGPFIGNRGVEIVRLLIDRGSDINSKDNKGQTALQKCLDLKNPEFKPNQATLQEILRLLQQRGAR